MDRQFVGTHCTTLHQQRFRTGFFLLSDGALQNESTMAIGWSLLGVLPLAFGLYWLQLVRKKHLAWLKIKKPAPGDRLFAI